MRGVVGGDHVDGAVEKRLLERLGVAGLAQRRVHAEQAVVGGELLVGEHEVVRGDLGGDVDALVLSKAQKLHGALGGGVAQVVAAAVVAGHDRVARHNGLLRHARPTAQAQARGLLALVGDGALGHAVVLGVLREHHVVRLGVLDGAAHQLRVVDALAVVGEHAHAAAGHQPDLGELLTLQPLGNGADRVDVALAVLLALRPHRLGEERLVYHRGGVRHGEHGGKTALGRGVGAGGDGLSVLAAGLAQVHVHVHQARQQHVAPAVHDLVRVVEGVLPDRVDHAVGDVDENVGHVLAVRADVVQSERGHLMAPSSALPRSSELASRVNSTAMRV